MKLVKKIAKGIGCILLIPVIYLLIAFLLTAITVNGEETNEKRPYTIYLSSNGVHLDIILEAIHLHKEYKDELLVDKYVAFGWGDKNFYLNTPEWSDVTFTNVFNAMFLKSDTLMHVTKYNYIRKSWTAIQISKTQLEKLIRYITVSFKKDGNGSLIKIKGESYGNNDAFYEAIGSYSCLKTCNTWVNQAFKESDIKACFWTPFDDGLLNKHAASK